MLSRARANLSLDLDNVWSYLKTRGRPEWVELPSYLNTLVPLALDALDRRGLRITFFIVGLDAEQPENQDVLGELIRRGHEVGNHSYHHEPWLHTQPQDEIRDELARAEDAIEAACGLRPTGFRGPGYSLGPEILEVLADRGYAFDASTLPTYIGPLARAYYFRAANLTPEEREQRADLFGTWADGRRPLKPYRWRLADGRQLLELPVTTLPGARTPIHLSYLLFLAQRSRALMRAYLAGALAACRATGTPISFLLHPLDIIGGDKAPQLAFFPGMALETAAKLDLFDEVLGLLSAALDIVPMGEFAAGYTAVDLPERAVAGDFA